MTLKDSTGFCVKYFFSVVLSVLDAHGNRLGAYEFRGAENREEAERDRAELAEKIAAGEFENIARPGEKLSADIEVHDSKTYSLLWIE